MSNLSYCRFRNTLPDLMDCARHFHDYDLSVEEHRARLQMLRIINELAGDYADELRYDKED